MRTACCIFLLCFAVLTAAAVASQAEPPTTNPALTVPSQFADEHICVELAPAPDGRNYAGFIGVGGYRTSRRFPLRATLDGKVVTGRFTDESGNDFAFTARMEGLRMMFTTGRTTYELSRVPGGIGVGLQRVPAGFRIGELVKDWPAIEAGMRQGDIITAIDGKPVAGEDAGSIGLRGDVGTQVSVSILRADGSTAQFTLRRAPLEVRPITPATADDAPDSRDTRRDR